MLRHLRFALVSLVSSLVVAGCAAGAAPTETTADSSEDVSTAEEALTSSGYYRIYYSDSTYQNGIGYEMLDCDNYREAEGDTSRYYKQTRWSCPDNPFPFGTTTTCWDCQSYTQSDGTVITSCTHWTCA